MKSSPPRAGFLHWAIGTEATMKTFYLQRGIDGREFIDDHLHDGSIMLLAADAACWKEAKAILVR